MVAVAGGSGLLGALLALRWRAPAARRAAAELARLDGLVREHAARAQAAQDEARLQHVRAEVEEAERRKSDLRATLAEEETELLRRALALHEATPCAICQVPPPLCPHGREERLRWLQEHGGGFPVPPAGAARGPRLPGPGEPGCERVFRDRAAPPRT